MNKSTKPRVYRATQFDVYCLGLTIVIGGQIIFWNKGLEEGFWKFFVSMLLVGAGYLCLTLCLAEMTSMMPFAGGSFGYVRCTLGPVTGYLVGCCEAAEYILYVASAVVEIGRLLTVITELSPSFEPLYWISFYAISLAIQMKGGRTFWRFNCIIALITLFLIVFYCLSSLAKVDFAKFAISDTDHNPGLKQPRVMLEDIMFFLPLVSWFYVGVESMTLSCDDIPQANRRVPWMMVMSMLTLLVTSISIVFASCSQAPGTLMLPYTDLPLSPGYAKIFQYDSPRFLAILAMPGTFSTSFGFMFAYGRQLKAMARSGLLPGYLGQAWGNESVPLTALLTGSIIGCSVLLFLWLLFPQAIDRLFGLCMLSSCTVYVAIFVSFLIARTRLDTVPRTFVSPFGRIGAVYGITIFSIMAVALSIFQHDNYVALIVYFIAIVIAIVHYALIARKREFLSLEEQAQFMKAYLLHSDAEYRRRMVRRSFANKHAFLRKVAPFSTQTFGGLSQRWNRSNVTAPVELLHGLDENQHHEHNSQEDESNNKGNNDENATSKATKTSTDGADNSSHAGIATTIIQVASSAPIIQQVPVVVSESKPTSNNSSSVEDGNRSVLRKQQQEIARAQENALKPHQLHLQSSLLLTAEENAASNAQRNHGYNANNHQMTLELEEKMRKLAEEIFAGQDEGQVTIVRSKHGRRSLSFRWKETNTVSDTAGSTNNHENAIVPILAPEFKEDAITVSAKDVAVIREATSTTTIAPHGNSHNNGKNNSDRMIRLAESDTAVEIIPGLAEEVCSPNDAYSFYPRHLQQQHSETANPSHHTHTTIIKQSGGTSSNQHPQHHAHHHNQRSSMSSNNSSDIDSSVTSDEERVTTTRHRK